MTTRDIVVIGASAGGVEALSRLVGRLPADFPASVFVTIHFPPQGISVLPRILSRAGALPVLHAEDGEHIKRGRVYVAPPDRHMLIYHGVIRLIRGPTENGNRPAIDPMFRSAAVAYGARVIGVVLTGNLDDGTAGLLAIKRRHGVAVVQNPMDAMFPSMPASAVQNVEPDEILKLDDIPAALVRYVAQEVPKSAQTAPLVTDDQRENAYSAFDLAVIEKPNEHPGHPSGFGCPDCGGALWQLHDGDLVRFRCRVGHGWTSDGLIERQDATLEAALWSALRALEESVALADQMSARFEKRGQPGLAQRYRDAGATGRQRAEVIREVLLRPRVRPNDDPAPVTDTAIRSVSQKH
jgi:two-component system, chemotaxis family, protein-glutamate methylesterase/glutaminase